MYTCDFNDKHLSFYPLCVSKESQWFPGEAGVPFIFASGSEFEEIWVGVGATRVRELMGESSLSLSIICTLSTLYFSLSLNQLILANSFQIFKRLLKQGKFLSFWTILPRKDLLHRWFKSWKVFSVWDYWCILKWMFGNVCVLETARKISPCIVFIDEIDSLASNRTHSLYTTEAANQTLNQLLTELDG